MTKETNTMTHPAPPASPAGSHRSRCALLAAVVALSLLFAAAAHADLAIQPGSFTVTTSSNQAGAHSDLTTSFAFTTDSNGALTGHPKDITVDLPVGFAGEPAQVPTCPISLFQSNSCPIAAQIGTVRLQINLNGFGVIDQTVPVFNITPAAGQTDVFGFQALVFQIQAIVSVRPNDYGLSTTVHNASAFADLLSSSLTLWGVPADPSHDAMRGAQCFGDPAVRGDCFGGGHSAGVQPVPFLRNPTSCTGSSALAVLSVTSWEQPSTVVTATTGVGPFTGCDKLGFQPSLSVQPSTTEADAPSGYTVDLEAPQNSNPGSLATADLRKAVVTLPRGVVLSPSAADGLQACTDAQVGLGNSNPVACPDGSKLGEATLTTPALPDQLTGAVYLGGPDSGPITGPPYRIFLTLAGDGVSVKLAGTVTPDPVTGQLTTTFDDNPQLPFSELQLVFKDGPRAPLANPSSCGTFTTTSDLEPWSAPDSGPDATPSDSFQITGCGAPSEFAPSFSAGTMNPQAGAYSPFTLTFSRSDQDQPFSGLRATLPPGLTAKLAGVPLCSDADASAGTCPVGSRVGSVETASGPGSHPFWLPGTAYLTGPYKGGPYGLAVEVPAVAGPFNLGMVVVRQALYIDPIDAHVTAVSDPFPTILGGIPLQIRTVSVTLNRPDFTLNPTSCDPMQVTGTLGSTGGMSEPVSSRFQVGGCGDLGFSPKLQFKLTGKGQTHSGQHPTLTATLTDPSGQANIRQAKVALPLSLALDPNNSQNVCNYDTAQAVHGGAVGCPASTIVGTATAVTPLLSQPLTGPVYLVQGIRFGPQGQRIRTLPSLLVPLRGQIALDLRASSSVNGAQQLVTTFSTIPDAPVSSFTLQINGGSRGILVITGRGKTICGKAQFANGQFGAQSGKQESQSPKFSTPACKGSAHPKRHKHH